MCQATNVPIPFLPVDGVDEYKLERKSILLKKTLSDDETLHAFKHLSLLDSDDEDWDTMKKEYKNAVDQCNDELEA